MAVIAQTQVLGDVLEPAMSWRCALRAQNKSPRTISVHRGSASAVVACDGANVALAIGASP